jgi:hypothetical protein
MKTVANTSETSVNIKLKERSIPEVILTYSLPCGTEISPGFNWLGKGVSDKRWLKR